MSDFNDTSYYEIALTNRQVVVAFVILLTMVLAVFLCGVWVGQNGQQRLAHADPSGPAPQEPEALANLEEFKFFEEQAEKQEELDKPDLGSLLDNPRQDTTLAQDIGAGAAPQRSAPPAAAPNPSPPPPDPAPPRQQPQAQTTQAAPTPPSPARAEPRQTAPPPPAPRRAAPPAAEGFVVQVFSTHDEPQARKLLKRLEGLGHRAFLSTIDVGGQTMFRVRVGPFAERGSAEKVKGQVRHELKLDPWVTAASN